MGYLGEGKNYLGEHDLGKEYGGRAHENPGRDYLGGRDKRDFIRESKEGRESRGERSSSSNEGKRDYLGLDPKIKELSRMADQMHEKAERITKEVQAREKKAATDAKMMKSKAAIMLIRIIAGLVVAQKVSQKAGKIIAGGAAGSFLGITFSPSPVGGCVKGKDCADMVSPDHYKQK